MKPKHQGGYTPEHVVLCERALVTLLRGLGPWKRGIYLVGGLVPRYLIPVRGDSAVVEHAGTTDVDILLDLNIIASIEAYRKLEENLRATGFERSAREGKPQHYRWKNEIEPGKSVVVDLLCDVSSVKGGQAIPVSGERRLSALNIPGAHLVTLDYKERTITAELLGDRGVARETVRVAGAVAFVVLKALAYEDRAEEKDAYDIVYCLMRYEDGPGSVANEFRSFTKQWPQEELVGRALAILRERFTTTGALEGQRKDGPVSYARFITQLGRSERDLANQRDAAAVVEAFLGGIDSGD